MATLAAMIPSPPSSARRAGTGAWIALGVALAIHAAFLVSLPVGTLDPLFVEASQGYGQASDFYGIYQAGWNLTHGYSIYDSADYLHEAPQVVPFYYFYRYLPPTAYGAAVLAALLPPRPAYWVWVALNELMIAAVVYSILRWRRWPASRRLLAAALWIGYFPLYIEQFMGQFSITMALLLWFLWRADTGEEGSADTPQDWRRRWRDYRWSEDRAGAAAGTGSWAGSLVLKSFSALLVLPYLRDARIKRLVAGAGLAVLACLPYFIARPRDALEFARLNFSPFTPAIYKGSFGFQTFLRDLLALAPQSWSAPILEIAGRTLSLAGGILLGASLLFFALALWATLRPWPGRARHALDLALWVCVFFLVFKSVWEYHYVMILPVITALFLTTGSRTVLVLGILLGLPTLFGATSLLTGAAPAGPLTAWPAWFQVLHFAVKSIPTVILFAWCLHASRRGRLRILPAA